MQTEKTLYHDIGQFIAFLLKKLNIKRVIHLASGEYTQLAIEMALRKVCINLPNALCDAIDGFCYRYWKHYFIYSTNQPFNLIEDEPQRNLMAKPDFDLFLDLVFGEPCLLTPGKHFSAIQSALQKYATFKRI
jgi:hypothetical protein